MTKSASSTHAATAPLSLAKTRPKINRLIRHDVAIDLGTSNTLIALEGKGLVVDQPSVVATNKKTKQVVAMGEEAKQMIGRAPSGLQPRKPLVGGVVSDYEVAEHMVRQLIGNLHRQNKVLSQHPKVVVSLPCSVTEVEQRAVVEAAKAAGAKRVYMIHEPVAAAIGMGLDIFSDSGKLVVDIGGGTTDIALIAASRTILTKTIRVAGDELSEAVRQHIRDEYSLQIGERTAEEAKLAVASVESKGKARSASIRGRNTVSGLPQELEIKSEQLKTLVAKQLRPIVEAIKSVIDETPPELLSDILKTGMYVSGGGSLIGGIDDLIRSETHINVNLAKNPMSAVVEGGLVALSRPSQYRRVLISVD